MATSAHLETVLRAILPSPAAYSELRDILNVSQVLSSVEVALIDGATAGTAAAGDALSHGAATTLNTIGSLDQIVVGAIVGGDNSLGITGQTRAVTANGGAVAIAGAASVAGATGNGGAVTIEGGASGADAGAGGAADVTGGLGTGSGNGGAITLYAGTGGITGTGGALNLTAGASAGIGGTAGAASLDAGCATGGTGAAVTIGAHYATNVALGRSGQNVTVSGNIITTVGNGAKNGGTVTAVENGDGVLHKTVLTCASTPIGSIGDEAGQGQYGGVKVYDFPEGLILTLGCVIDGAVTLASPAVDTWDGDIGLGVEAVTDHQDAANKIGQILQSTATSTAVSKVATVDAIQIATLLTESGARWRDGTATALDLYLNLLIDDDVAHDNTITGTFTGTITFTWINLGDK